MRVCLFALLLSLCFNSCDAAAWSDQEFYEGLNKRHSQDDAVICFSKALNAHNPYISAASAAELMNLFADGAEISPVLMTAIRQKARGSWAAAFEVLDTPIIPGQSEEKREKLLALLLNGESRSLDSNSVDTAAARYLVQKWQEDSIGITPGEAEHAIINGRIAASRSRYNEALLFFRIALNDSPDLFFRYPDLLIDLGRTFQYTASGNEGMQLFLNWERIFSNNDLSDIEASMYKAAPEETVNLIRFRLLFFAARIARQRSLQNKSDECIELFERALPYAREVSTDQTDACIWYILDAALGTDTDNIIKYLTAYIPQWHDDAYFFDVMEKLARELILKRQWEYIEKIYNLLRERAGAATAQYAWIMSRLIDEGLLSSDISALEYMRSAYNAGEFVNRGHGAWYYRSLSAAALGEPFLVLTENPEPENSSQKNQQSKTAARTKAAKGKASDESDALQFILGFFNNNTAHYAARYARSIENDLSVEELYRVAKAFGEAGQYQESFRLVSLYVGRDDYHIKKQDLELLYPCPYKDLVEQCADTTGIEAALLFGLIRTESAFESDIVSSAGAIGLTQLMHATAEETAARIRRHGGPDYFKPADEENNDSTTLDLYDPALNIHLGAAYYAWLNERMENSLLALLAYNGGMNRVRRWRESVNRSVGTLAPDLFLETVEYTETRNYGRTVLGAAAMYRELYYHCFSFRLAVSNSAELPSSF